MACVSSLWIVQCTPPRPASPRASTHAVHHVAASARPQELRHMLCLQPRAAQTPVLRVRRHRQNQWEPRLSAVRPANEVVVLAARCARVSNPNKRNVLSLPVARAELSAAVRSRGSRAARLRVLRPVARSIKDEGCMMRLYITLICLASTQSLPDMSVADSHFQYGSENSVISSNIDGHEHANMHP